MARASKFFTQEQRKEIADAVAEAESKTSAEIVPVVATDSGRYDRAEDSFGLVLGLLTLPVLWLLFEWHPGSQAQWGPQNPLNSILRLMLGVFGGYLVGAFAASRIGPLRRLFTTRREMYEEVESRAQETFFDQRIHHTQGGTGLLIYVSLYEHIAVVFADEAVNARLGQTALDELCKTLTDNMHSGNPTLAFVATIRAAGEKLSKVMPREANDRNELPDALVILD